MVLTFDTFRDKMQGCWAGKNAGGVADGTFDYLCVESIHPSDQRFA